MCPEHCPNPAYAYTETDAYVDTIHGGHGEAGADAGAYAGKGYASASSSAYASASGGGSASAYGSAVASSGRRLLTEDCGCIYVEEEHPKCHCDLEDECWHKDVCPPKGETVPLQVLRLVLSAGVATRACLGLPDIPRCPPPPPWWWPPGAACARRPSIQD